MTLQNLKRFDFIFGLILVLSALAILFIIPLEELYQNGGRYKLGDIYRGLEAILGQNGARLLLSLPFLGFGYLLMRKAFKQENPTLSKRAP